MTVRQAITLLQQMPQHWTLCYETEELKPDGSIEERTWEVEMVDIQNKEGEYFNEGGEKCRGKFVKLI